MKQKMIKDRNRFIAELVKGKTVLDIGCVNHSADEETEDHWLHGILVRHAADVVGIDYEEAEVLKLQKRGYSVICADATCFDLAKENGDPSLFDMVVAGEVMEHLLDEQGFLKSAANHLHPDGRLVISVPNALCLTYFISNLLRGRELDNEDHVCLYSETTLKRLLTRCGFVVEETLYFPELTGEHGFGFLVRLYLQKAAGIIRPSLCHHILLVARKA